MASVITKAITRAPNEENWACTFLSHSAKSNESVQNNDWGGVINKYFPVGIFDLRLSKELKYVLITRASRN